MIGIKPILRIVSLLAVAVAAGQLVETQRNKPVPDSIAVGDVEATGVGEVVAITPVAATTETLKTDACATALQLAALPGAMIDLTLSAPCHRGERVVLRHVGLSFTAVVGPDGQLRLQFPAFEGNALVAAYLDNAQVALGQVTVPDIAEVTRFGVQMPSLARFDLRAETVDGVYVSAASGAVDNGSPRVLALGAAQAADPIVAQVYTHPASDLSAVELTVDLRITDRACGRMVPVETWLSQNGRVTRGGLEVSVPACGTSGDILVLKNLLPTPTLRASE